MKSNSKRKAGLAGLGELLRPCQRKALYGIVVNDLALDAVEIKIQAVRQCASVLTQQGYPHCVQPGAGCDLAFQDNREKRGKCTGDKFALRLIRLFSRAVSELAHSFRTGPEDRHDAQAACVEEIWPEIAS